MAKKKPILNPEIHQAGLEVVRQIVNNAPKPLEMAELLYSRFHDLEDSYSIGISQGAKEYINATSQRGV